MRKFLRQKKRLILKRADLIEKHNVSIITIFDDTYPKILKSMPDPPFNFIC